MKKNTRHMTIVISLAALASLGFISIPNKSKIDLIIGTWISEEDSNWKFIFQSPNTCLEFYTGESTEEYSYSISNSSPQCGFNVPVNQHTSYLELIKKSNNKRSCYEITSLNDEYLTLRVVNKGGFMVFIRQ